MISSHLSELPDDALEAVYAATRDIRVAIPYQHGDVTFIDNHACMHSREPYTGPRRILASLAV